MSCIQIAIDDELEEKPSNTLLTKEGKKYTLIPEDIDVKEVHLDKNVWTGRKTQTQTYRRDDIF